MAIKFQTTKIEISGQPNNSQPDEPSALPFDSANRGAGTHCLTSRYSGDTPTKSLLNAKPMQPNKRDPHNLKLSRYIKMFLNYLVLFFNRLRRPTKSELASNSRTKVMKRPPYKASSSVNSSSPETIKKPLESLNKGINIKPKTSSTKFEQKDRREDTVSTLALEIFKYIAEESQEGKFQLKAKFQDMLYDLVLSAIATKKHDTKSKCPCALSKEEQNAFEADLSLIDNKSHTRALKILQNLKEKQNQDITLTYDQQCFLYNYFNCWEKYHVTTRNLEQFLIPFLELLYKLPAITATGAKKSVASLIYQFNRT